MQVFYPVAPHRDYDTVEEDRADRLEATHGVASRKGRVVGRVLAFLGIVATFIVLTAPAMDEPPTDVALKAIRAQETLDALRIYMGISQPVQIEIVIYDPLVFSVKPVDGNRDSFRLSMELGFLDTLSDEELRAALAHELGHVKIFTQHPYLQTERLANDIGLQAVSRGSLEKVYRKLWWYEGSTGVAIERLLGPPVQPPASAALPRIGPRPE